ncbi:hypothetical protein [Solimicrobium silvestre]|uniref:Uncharacterized protein n=1 Tax=Solimicrobium silvestre TaxID=2099400 RepID=A0A2S9H0U9_9BURK|nr:hypothetical protein [Solimicrobium silvestre]PRC93601.1 hypothetical protein S2091_1602 [Solimicrobium silvestre]
MNFKLRVLKKIVFVVFCIAALSWLVMVLWNWLIPSLFIGAREIDYARAIGLLILSRILFGGLRGHHGHHERHADHEHWHSRWHQHRWEKMTQEEREKFQNGILSARDKHKQENQQ